MRTNIQIVYPRELLIGKESAFSRMRKMYQDYADPKFNFWEDFLDYAENGFVRISPNAMWFAKACHDNEGDFWFVRAAVGTLPELLASMPAFLPRISFCRRNDGVIRFYRTDRLLRLVASRCKNTAQNVQR